MEELRKLQYLALVSKVTTGAGAAAAAWRPRARRSVLVFGWAALPQAGAHVIHSLVSGLRRRTHRPTRRPPTPPCAELENNLGIADKTLSEFIIELSKGKASAREFGAALKGNGAELPESLTETLWNVIQKLRPGGGLAIPDTRDMVKQMEAEMIAEGEAKRRAAAEAERQASHEHASTRGGGRDGRDDGDRRRERYRSRSRSPRGQRGGGGGSPRRRRSRSRSPRRQRSPPRALPEEPEMYGVYRVCTASELVPLLLLLRAGGAAGPCSACEGSCYAPCPVPLHRHSSPA